MNQEKNQFRLNVLIDKRPPLKIDVVDVITVGLDPRNDLVLVGKKINNRHLSFELKGENLALHYLGFSNQTFLNNLPLEEGKIYLLEVGDKINLTDVEITVLLERVLVHETQKIKPLILQTSNESLPNLRPLPIIKKENGLLKKLPQLPMSFIKVKPKATIVKTIVEPVVVVKSVEDVNFVSLWLIKFYSLICDIFFTYLLLAVVFPLVRGNVFAKNIINYFTSIVFPLRHHSIFYFFVAWYILSFAQTLILGTTIGQFLLGLRYKTTNSFFKIVYLRIKAFIFSLLLLPAQNTYKSNFVFKAMRKVGIFVIIIFILFSPFIMPAPFNTPVTLINIDDQITKELHTRTISSFSKDLGMGLSTELSYRYMLMPLISGGLRRRSFQFVDLIKNQSLTVVEKENYAYEELQERLSYANPLYSVVQPISFSILPIKDKKQILEDALLITPLHLKNSAKSFGPFFGNALNLKSLLLDKNEGNDIALKTYKHETPLLFIGSTQQDFFYLFGPTSLLKFQVESQGNRSLAAVFEKFVFSKLVPEPDAQFAVTDTKPTILSVQDAFLHGHEDSILTYYVEIANSLMKEKTMYEEVDLTEKAKLALLGNIKSNQKFITDVNVYRSFTNLINQLTPMEKPGEKR